MPGPERGFAFPPEDTLPHLQREQQRMASDTEGVSISLKYYRQETECISEWQHGDLKKLSNTVDKIRGMTAATLRRHGKLCVKHRTQPKLARFSRPAGLARDLPLYEIKVGPSDAARIHGVFVGSVFFVIWLDRRHQVYPE